jgi:hypothetical protein
VTAIICAFKGGGEYQPEHVARLCQQVAQHAPAGTLCICFTDQPEAVTTLGIDVMPLEHNWPGSPRKVPRFNVWPGWWAKMEVFRFQGPALYLDLDSTVVGNLEPLLHAAEVQEFVVCGDFWVEGPHRINTSVMAWRGDVSELYREFAAAPEAHMSVYTTRENWGDQGFVRDHWLGEFVKWQELLPGAVISYKLGVLKGEDTSNARVIVHHGHPKPWQV